MTRQQAKTLGLLKFFTGQPCKHGHVARRYVSVNACEACVKDHTAKLRGSEDKKARDRAYRQENREACLLRVRQWKKRNRGRCVASEAARRGHIARATPPWADLREIRSVYDEAARLSATTGVLHHVDHVIPLRGRTVCGLHVPANLEARPALDNLQKSNTFSGDCGWDGPDPSMAR